MSLAVSLRAFPDIAEIPMDPSVRLTRQFTMKESPGLEAQLQERFNDNDIFVFYSSSSQVNFFIIVDIHVSVSTWPF